MVELCKVRGLGDESISSWYRTPTFRESSKNTELLCVLSLDSELCTLNVAVYIFRRMFQCLRSKLGSNLPLCKNFPQLRKPLAGCGNTSEFAAWPGRILWLLQAKEQTLIVELKADETFPGWTGWAGSPSAKVQVYPGWISFWCWVDILCRAVILRFYCTYELPGDLVEMQIFF